MANLWDIWTDCPTIWIWNIVKAAPGWQGQQQGGGEELGWGVPPSSLWLLLGRRPTGNWGPPLLPPYFPSLPHPRILPNLFINSTISTWHLHGQWTHVLDLVTLSKKITDMYFFDRSDDRELKKKPNFIELRGKCLYREHLLLLFVLKTLQTHLAKFCVLVYPVATNRQQLETGQKRKKLARPPQMITTVCGRSIPVMDDIHKDCHKWPRHIVSASWKWRCCP